MSSLVVPQTRQRSAARSRAPASARRLPQGARLLLLGCALAALLAAGCSMYGGPSRVLDVTPGTFNDFVLGSQQPVLVNFYKPG